MTQPSLGRFVLRTFLWLAPCFAAWYFSAHYSAAVAGALARLWVGLFNSNIVSALEQPVVNLVFVTTLEIHPATDQAAVVLAEVNPLLYTYGLPLFLALMLAARAKWWKIAIGALALLPFQAWGIAFDFLAQVGMQLGYEVAQQAGFSAAQREVIALGYQLGALILPTLAPVVAWALFSRRFIETTLIPSGHPRGSIDHRANRMPTEAK